MEYAARFTNLVKMFADSVSKFGDRPLFGLKRDGAWQWLTYLEVSARIDALRGGLAGMGIGKGDRVAVISNNRIEWFAGAYACYGLGAIYVPMYEHQLDKEWLYILRDSGAKACMVASDGIDARVKKLQADLPSLEHVINFDGNYAAICAEGEKNLVHAIEPADNDVCCMVYTSGTTGNPKGVRLTHANLAKNVSAVTSLIPADENDRSLSFLPWAHLFGGSIELNGMISLGASVGICEDVTALIGQLPEVRPTMLFAVPRIWNRIYDGVQKQIRGKPAAIQSIFHAGMRAASKEKSGESKTLWEMIALPLARWLIFGKIKEKFGGELKFACSGAAALSPDVAEFVDNLGIIVLEGYGMTETSGVTTCNSMDERRIGSVGKAIPGCWVKLDHTVAGSDDQNGEIVIYGHGIMDGYHNLPEVTTETMTEDGGLRSGDLGKIDADGFISITGRVKEIYKLENGKYVAPAPLEEKITLSPYIAQIMVYGDNKPHNVALVVPDEPSLKEWAGGEVSIDDEKTRGLIQAEIEKYSAEFKGFERIRNFAVLSQEFSTDNDMLTPTLKIKRRNVLKEYGDQLQSLY